MRFSYIAISKVIEAGEFEGMPFRVHLRGEGVSDEEHFQPGDTYLAERNLGVRLLTVKKVHNGYIIPVEPAYPYDVWECVKIEFDI